MPVNKETIKTYLMGLQDNICNQIADWDGTKFQEDLWERHGGGGGRTRVMAGKYIEKGGVNFSAVEGELSPFAAKSIGIDAKEFFAAGVSIVMHPKSPLHPIIHMNVRYFEAENGAWWFGGGIDLTPHYVNAGEAKLFHATLKTVCDQHNLEYYPKFKKWADDYFFIDHRQETRGVGGIFYDHMNQESGVNKEDAFAFTKGIGDAFAQLYIKILDREKDKSYSEHQSTWQYLRRGRYAEFNLVYDRGTKFGLQTDGRTESILMSLPPQANWEYNHQVEVDSPEYYTLNKLKKDINWLEA